MQVTSADSCRMRGIEGVGMVELVFFGGLLTIRGDSLLQSVWRPVGDRLTVQGELDVWIVRAGTWQPGNLHRNRIGYLPKLVSCRLLTAKSRSVRGASHQPAFTGSYLFVKRVCPVHLVDRYSYEKNVFCSNWKGEYVQGQTWTLVMEQRNWKIWNTAIMGSMVVMTLNSPAEALVQFPGEAKFILL